MISVSRRNATVVAWSHATPDEVTKRFWNTVLRDNQLALRVHVLNSLFAVPPPVGAGKYRHHDGYRS